MNISRQTFTNLDTVEQDVRLGEPVCIEPTVSGTRYIFSLNGRLREKEMAGSSGAYADGDDDEYSDSNSEDIETDDDTEVQTTTTRITAFPKIVFLGTGSSFPGVTKTTTSLLVHTT